MTTSPSGLLFLLLALLLGWLAGGLVNWAADVLPVRDRGGPADARQPPPDATRRTPLWHYLTLPWYPFRRGLCLHCGAPRPRRVPAVEATSIIAFIVCLLLAAPCLPWTGLAASQDRLSPAPCPPTPDPWSLAALWLYTAFLLAVIVIDFEHRRVLNVMLGPAALVALGLSLRPAGPGIVSAVLGGLAGFALFALIALLGRGKMGAGDVKLAGVIGLMTGFPAVFAALLLGIILGGLAALLLILSRRAGLKSYIAYAPYLAIAAWVVLLAAAR